MSDIEPDEAGPRRWPALLLLATALVWIGIAAAVTVTGAQDYAKLAGAPLRENLVIIGSFVLQMLPPLAVAVLALTLISRQRPRTREQLRLLEERHEAVATATGAVARDLEAVDVMLDRISTRVGELRASAADQGGGLTVSAGQLDAAATRLVESASRAKDAGIALTAALPETQARAQGLAALLDASSRETQRQLGDVETMLSGLWTASDEAARRHEASVASAQERLTALAALADQTAARVGEQGDALHRVAETALAATTTALDTTRAGVDVQTAALLASVDQARVALDHIGGEAMRVMQKRLDRLLEAADTLGQSLSEQDARSKTFIETVERSFTVLDAKLGNATASGSAALDTLADRMAKVSETVHQLGEPLAGTNEAVGEIEISVGRLEAAAGAVIRSLGSDLPATHDGVTALARDVEAVREHLTGLGPTVEGTDATVQRIAAGLTDARTLAGEVETATGTGGVAATNQLIEVLGRVREVADQTAGTMRTALGAVIAEAESALAEAGGDTARLAFGGPIRAELDAVRAAADQASVAAQGAAERVSQRLLGLTGVIASVEARIDEVDTAYDVKLRDDLARRAEGLVGSLNAAAIEISDLLDVAVGEGAWTEYLKGDRGVFARRAIKQLDEGAGRKIARHFQHDAAFREQAVRFITEFETLMKRVHTDREGKALELTLLTSDLGKLYVLLDGAAKART